MPLKSPIQFLDDDFKTRYFDRSELLSRLTSMSHRLHMKMANYDDSIENILPEVKNLIDQSYKLIADIPSDDVLSSHRRLNDYLFDKDISCDDTYIFQDKHETVFISSIYSTGENSLDDSVLLPMTPQANIKTN